MSDYNKCYKSDRAKKNSERINLRLSRFWIYNVPCILENILAEWRIFNRWWPALTSTSFETIGFSRASRVCGHAFHVRLTCKTRKHVRLSTFLRRQDCRTTGMHPRFHGAYTSRRLSMQRYDTIRWGTRRFIKRKSDRLMSLPSFNPLNLDDYKDAYTSNSVAIKAVKWHLLCNNDMQKYARKRLSKIKHFDYIFHVQMRKRTRYRKIRGDHFENI